MAKNPFEMPYMKKKAAAERREEIKREHKKNFAKAERGWEEAGQEFDFEKILEEKVEKAEREEAKRKGKLAKAAGNAEKMEPTLKKMRAEILFGKKAEEAREELVSEDDWKGREEEGARLLAEFEKEKEAAWQASEEEGARLLEKSERDKREEEDLREFLKREEPEKIEAVELKKLSKDELRKRISVLSRALGEILQDAASAGLSPQDKSALKKWMKKSGKVEEWPLDDKVTAKNYRERLGKYGISGYINPDLIEPHKDAYAVANKQLRAYEEELANFEKRKKGEGIIIEPLAGTAEELPQAEEFTPIAELTKKKLRKEESKKPEEEIEVSDEDIIESVDLDEKRKQERKDVLGIGKVLKEESKRYEKSRGKNVAPAKKKKRFLERIFGK